MHLFLKDFEAQSFRSLHRISYPASNLDVFIGPNGVGKTNLYRALELLQSAASNNIAHEIGGDGGLSTVIWAGETHRSEKARIRVAVGLSTDLSESSSDGTYRYEFELGFPPCVSAAFPNEAQIKSESVSFKMGGRLHRLLERRGRSIKAKDQSGSLVQIKLDLLDSETALGRLEDPSRYGDLDIIRRTLLQWRFYHGFRSDEASPIRRACPAFATAMLAPDGSNLAAVFATLRYIREDTADLDAVIEQAFPGAELVVPCPEQNATFGMSFPEFPRRVFAANELSDGTLRFLALTGALLAYRLPPFIALNEPEASLHPDLMEPLGRLIARAAERTQLWLVTHSTRLADAIVAAGKANIRTVKKAGGATTIEGLKPWGAFADEAES